MFPIVSIILPTYNRADLLTESISSVFEQNYPNWELIVWDDGSTDNTSKIIEALNDSRVRYYYHKNQGKSFALNNAINKANGDYIAFLDDDDQWVGDKISLQMDVLIKNPDVDVVFGNFNNINLATGEQGVGFQQSIPALKKLKKERIGDDSYKIMGNFFEGICAENFIAFDTVIARRNIMDKTGDFNENLRNGEDFEYWWRLALMGGVFAYTNEIVLNRIKYPQSLSSPGITTFENTLRGLVSCSEEAIKMNRPYLATYLTALYRNAWQNMMLVYSQERNPDKVFHAFMMSLKYGFTLGSLRLLIQSALSSVLKSKSKRRDN